MRVQQLLMARIEAVCHYLMFKREINDEIEKYKDTILCPEFIREFETILRSSLDYPIHAKENAYKIIEVIKKEITDESVDYLKELVERKKYSNEMYEAEFSLRNNSIDFDKDYFVWTLDDMEKSVEFDILFINSLLANKKKYLLAYSDHFVMNPHFLSSVNKYALLKPYIFDEDAIFRIVNIIYTNREIIDDEIKTLRNEYLGGNNNPKILEKIKRLNWLYTTNDNTLIAVMNLNKSKFMLVTLRIYYEMLAIDEYLYNDNKMDTDWISLMGVYKYIENKQDIDNISKRRLIELLHSKRNNPKGEDLEEYNKHLRKLNSLTDSIYDYALADIFNKTEQFVVPGKKKNGEVESIMDDIKKSIKTNFKTFDTLLSDENNCVEYSLEHPECVYSLVKYINEMPSLFMNVQLNVRARMMLEENENKITHESKKVLEKMVGMA